MHLKPGSPPLYWRAIESQRPEALLIDQQAIELVEKFPSIFDQVKGIRVHELFYVMRIMLTRQMDCYVEDFLTRHPDSVVVHIGCGLDSRFDRVDNGQVEWFDLDLPEAIELRQQIIGGESGRYHLIACSVLEDQWFDAVKPFASRPILFLAETVFMYFTAEQVKSLVSTLHAQFPNSELVFDAWKPYEIWLGNRYLSKSLFARLLQWASGVVSSWKAGAQEFAFSTNGDTSTNPNHAYGVFGGLPQPFVY